MIKILHTADVHLDSPLKSLALRDPELKEQIQTATRSAFTQIIDTAISEPVDALLISGDLFDGSQRSAKTAAYLVSELDRLRDANIKVFEFVLKVPLRTNLISKVIQLVKIF